MNQAQDILSGAKEDVGSLERLDSLRGQIGADQATVASYGGWDNVPTNERQGMSDRMNLASQLISDQHGTNEFSSGNYSGLGTRAEKGQEGRMSDISAYLGQTQGERTAAIGEQKAWIQQNEAEIAAARQGYEDSVKKMKDTPLTHGGERDAANAEADASADAARKRGLM